MMTTGLYKGAHKQNDISSPSRDAQNSWTPIVVVPRIEALDNSVSWFFVVVVEIGSSWIATSKPACRCERGGLARYSHAKRINLWPVLSPLSSGWSHVCVCVRSREYPAIQLVAAKTAKWVG